MNKKDRPIKTAPNSKESEMMVLGSMLTGVNALNVACDILNPNDFYYSEHKIIFDVLKQAYCNDKPADIHLISEELKRQEKLEKIGGIAYLTALAQYAGTSAYVEQYAQLIRDKSLLRKMIDAAQEIEKNALEEPEDVHNILDDAQAKFFSLSEQSQDHQAVFIKELLSGTKGDKKLPYLKDLQERQEQFQVHGDKTGGIVGIPTHFSDLDKVLGGMSPSNLIILAARPAMGKTALALNIAENICLLNNSPVAVFSLEMSAEQLLHRVICSQSEVESDKIKSGSLNGNEYQRIVSAVKRLQKHQMIIDDQPGLKITDLRSRARRMKELYKIEFIVIDYLQLLSGSGNFKSNESRQMEISEISRMLKNLARELNIPILCLSQLSRKVEERQGHRPMMSDLRESGCVTGDTLIKDANTNEIYTIKQLAERKQQAPIYVYGMDKNLKLVKAKMVKAFFSGKKMTYKLITRSGREIKASANHPFKKLDEWERLDQLVVGDRIALPRKHLLNEKKSKVSKSELILLAHLLGDGCILPNQPYHYTSADLENIKTVEEQASQLFGIKPRRVKQKNWYHVYLTSPHRLTHKTYHPITTWFEKLSIKRVHSYNKKIPSAVLESSSSDIALFLKHLWATDGNISLKKMKGRKTSATIYYASSSQTLAQQVQHLLLCLGIQSSIQVQKSKKYRSMYQVQIQNNSNKIKFLKEVGCVGKREKLIPQLLSLLNDIIENHNTDVIPKEAWSTTIKSAKENVNSSWRKIAKGLDMSYCGSTLFKSGISRLRMKKLHDVLKDPAIENLAGSDVYWDEIKSIEPLQEEEVYDATVEEIHNFIANDIIIHNSIEQDSDQVLFLLRREYYDPYDKPGLAELIVAKNRHGSVGNIQLVFRKELAQFANYSSDETGDSSNDEAFSAFNPD